MITQQPLSLFLYEERDTVKRIFTDRKNSVLHTGGCVCIRLHFAKEVGIARVQGSEAPGHVSSLQFSLQQHRMLQPQ